MAGISAFYDKARSDLSQQFAGQQASAARGTRAQLAESGLGNAPSIQTAAQNRTFGAMSPQYSRARTTLDMAQSRDEMEETRRTGEIARIKDQIKQEKDWAKRSMLWQTLGDLVATGLTIATAGAGAPIAGAISAGTRMATGQQPGIQTNVGRSQTPLDNMNMPPVEIPPTPQTGFSMPNPYTRKRTDTSMFGGS